MLKSLYLKASLLVSTSNYEGFGINIIEAINLNCPVLSNNIDVFQNIYNKSIDYYNFNDLDHLIEKLENILIENNYKSNQKKIIDIKNNFKWKNCADKTYEVYKLID